jgi:hypothetical protein
LPTAETVPTALNRLQGWQLMAAAVSTKALPAGCAGTWWKMRPPLPPSSAMDVAARGPDREKLQLLYIQASLPLLLVSGSPPLSGRSSSRMMGWNRGSNRASRWYRCNLQMKDSLLVYHMPRQHHPRPPTVVHALMLECPEAGGDIASSGKAVSRLLQRAWRPDRCCSCAGTS